MPNYCYHHMQCIGGSTDVAALKQRMFGDSYAELSTPVNTAMLDPLGQQQSSGLEQHYDIDSVQFDFNRVIAMPQDLLVDLIYPLSAETNAKLAANKAKHGYPSWYDWSIEQWGTKWNALNTQILNDEDGYLALSFETAWTPAIPVYQELSRQFPKVLFSIHYIDEGYGFAGTYQGFAGRLHHHDHTSDIEAFAEEVFGWTTETYDPLSHEYDREAYEHSGYEHQLKHSYEQDAANPLPHVDGHNAALQQPLTYFK